MNSIKKWINARAEKRKNKKSLSNDPIRHKETSKNAAFYGSYYSLVAHGARLKLIEPMFRLNLFPLFHNKASILESDIIETLDLHPVRAKKWLHLLSCENFLIKTVSNNQFAYQLSNELHELMDNEGWATMKAFFYVWQIAADENLTDALRFGEVKQKASWPPQTSEEAMRLESWMTVTAVCTISCILEQIDFKKITHFLDVGGGDGTMACAFVTAHPHLKATVYNLPESAKIARKQIEAKGLSERVQVIEGDFIKDDCLPEGFDLILFSRVMYDWDEQVNRKLIKMAYQALPHGGLIAICEIFKEYNPDFCLSCEYRYVFLDDFPAHVMKTEADYRVMLHDARFKILPNRPSLESYAYSSILLAAK